MSCAPEPVSLGAVHPPSPSAIANAVSAALCPPRCPGCRRLVTRVHAPGLCDGCRAALRPPAPGRPPIRDLDQWFAATAYVGPAIGIVSALKSGAIPAAAGIAAELIAEAIAGCEPGTVLVPVGASPLRRLARGLDPAGAIAEALAARLDLALADALRRRDRRRQRGRPREARLLTPPRFRVRGRPPERVLLVDDVLTTGGTLSSCAGAMRSAGSVRIAAVAFARAPLPTPP